MSLQQRVTDELKSSMMARQAVRTGTLRMLKAALGYAQIEKKTETLSDADVMAVIQREAKKRRDAIEEFEKGGRAEMAANERAELWDLPGFPDRGGIAKAIMRHVLDRPWDKARLTLLRKAALYLTRKPRGLGGHRAAGD